MKDNFSKQADEYAKYRPDYPQALFGFLLSYVKERSAAWDCATGNGQTAKELGKNFVKVFATDSSSKQLDNAEQLPNIFYSLQPAEQTNFPDNSFDLITVSQALHWLSFPAFYTEATRVAKPGGWIAAWMYSLPGITVAIDNLITIEFYKNILAGYWDYERKYVDENYKTLSFPFNEIKCPLFQMEYEWTLDQLNGFLNTWSAVQKFITVNGHNPVNELTNKIKPLWVTEKMKVSFPLHMRMGQIDK